MPKSAKAHKFSNTKRTRDSVSPTSPTMNPAGMGGTPAKEPLPEKVMAPDIKELIADTEDLEIISALISVHASLTLQLKPLEEAKQRASDRIKELIKPYGITEATYQGASLSYYKSERHTLSKVKLLEAGVDMLTIQACEDTSVSWALKITPAKP